MRNQLNWRFRTYTSEAGLSLTASKLTKIFLVFSLCFAVRTVCADEPSEVFLKGLYEETVTGDLERAISFFRLTARDAHNKRLAARALYRLARCLEKLGKVDEACETLTALIKKFPDDELAPSTSQTLSRLAPPKADRTKWITLCRQQSGSLKEAQNSVRSRTDYIKSVSDEKAVLLVMDTKKQFSITDSSNLKELVKEALAQKLVARYITSRVFALGVGFYRNLQYEKAESQFSAAVALDSTFAPAKEYLEKTEFILGKRKTISPELLTSLSATSEDPIRAITKAAEELLSQGQKLYDERKYDSALEKFDIVESEIFYLSSELVTERISKMREKAALLGNDCLMNLFPAHTGEMRILREEREETGSAVKKALDALLAAENELVQKAQDALRRSADNAQKSFELAQKLFQAGQLQKAKELLLQALSLDPANEAAKTLLAKVEESLKQGR
jgi:tetratricopeptide (TPR) repeat protein